MQGVEPALLTDLGGSATACQFRQPFITVDERQAKTFRDDPADRGLTRTHQTEQHDVGHCGHRNGALCTGIVCVCRSAGIHGHVCPDDLPEEERAMTTDDDLQAFDEGDAVESLKRRDPEVPEADALDQAREVVPGGRLTEVSRAIDAPEADAVEQAFEEPVDAEDEAPAGDDYTAVESECVVAVSWRASPQMPSSMRRACRSRRWPERTSWRWSLST